MESEKLWIRLHSMASNLTFGIRKLITFYISVNLAIITSVIALNAASQKGQITNLPIPRFVSLKTSKGNIRRGPSLSHKIDWVLVVPNIPLKVVEEYEHWRRVVDYEGASGWIHYSLISGARTAMVLKDMESLYKKPSYDSVIKANIQANAIGQLGECNKNWCFIKFSNDKGWVNREFLWGLTEGEIR